MEVSGRFHAPVALTPEKSPRYPLDRSRSERDGEEKNPIIAPAGNWRKYTL
jgi:hypothetical protein